MTTGAIVLRQPFGGVGKSAFGPGIKAGGPNYVAQLMTFADRPDRATPPDNPVASPEVEVLRKALVKRRERGLDDAALPARDNLKVLAAIASYHERYLEEFGREHDHFKLVGQDNHRRYKPVPSLRVRVTDGDSPFDIFARVCAAKTAGCRITVSRPPGYSSAALDLLDKLTEWWGAAIEFVAESDEALAAAIAAHKTDRVRYAGGDVPEAVLRAVGDTGIYIARSPVLVEGRIELLWYVSEQSISHDYHRYGNLGARGDEKRRPVP